jgi:uncharacterized protein DUF5060/uncharacterized protein DUF4038/uncharacterized protein DUF5605
MSYSKYSLRWPAGLAVAALLIGALTGRSGAAEPARTVRQWEIFELELKGPAEGNPFLDVRMSALFSDGSRSVEATGFYDGDGLYRVRFMPDHAGVWRYETRSNRWPLAGQIGTFTVAPAAKGNHGPVRVRNTYHFAYADGTPFKPIGTTIYNWTDTPDEVQAQTLQTLAAAPFNKVRMLLTPQPTPYQKSFAPPRWPFAGKPPREWDFTRFNPEYFRHYEQQIGKLAELGIEADVILFNPYGKFGFETMSAEADDRYVRYVVARFAAYRNVWWSLANEYDFLRTKTEADWDRIGALVQQSDPSNHLRSIHNGANIYDHNKPWVTHASIQNGLAVEEPGRAEMYRDVYRKPVVYDEVKYEGQSPYRWGNLSGEEMVHRFWCGTVAGTYVGHGDYFLVNEDTWTSFGGTLKGTSVPRLAFLRKILEEGPAEGIDPIDRWQDPRVGGKPGDYYLIYFGHETPASWPFRLYKNGVTAGMKFKVDVIDTWAMTSTPVEGEFVARKKDGYDFVDAQGRAVPLPGKPGMAIRIRRLGADGAPVKLELLDPS